MDGVEKIICCDRGNNDALAYAAMANKQSDPMAMAAMMNGGMGNQWMNNPFAYIMFLALFGGAGFGGLATVETSCKMQKSKIRLPLYDHRWPTTTMQIC